VVNDKIVLLGRGAEFPRGNYVAPNEIKQGKALTGRNITGPPSRAALW